MCVDVCGCVWICVDMCGYVWMCVQDVGACVHRVRVVNNPLKADARSPVPLYTDVPVEVDVSHQRLASVFSPVTVKLSFLCQNKVPPSFHLAFLHQPACVCVSVRMRV